MIEQDTIRLLRECDAGAKMGIASIQDVMKHVQNGDLRRRLADGKLEHQRLETEIREQLDRFQDQGKDPGAVAQTMSRLTTEWKLTVRGADSTAAELVTDGCNMGVKSLSRYLNQYRAADEGSRETAEKLIRLEARMAEEMRSFL